LEDGPDSRVEVRMELEEILRTVVEVLAFGQAELLARRARPLQRRSAIARHEIAGQAHQFLGVVLLACGALDRVGGQVVVDRVDRKSTRLNSSHVEISYAVFCLKKKNRGRYHPAI